MINPVELYCEEEKHPHDFLFVFAFFSFGSKWAILCGSACELKLKLSDCVVISFGSDEVHPIIFMYCDRANCCTETRKPFQITIPLQTSNDICIPDWYSC